MTPEPNIPAYPLAATVAKANEQERRSMIRRLAGVGILERHGGRWCVSQSRLRERLPDYFDRLYEFERKRQETARGGNARQEPAIARREYR